MLVDSKMLLVKPSQFKLTPVIHERKQRKFT